MFTIIIFYTYAAIDDLPEILREVKGAAAWWCIVGVCLKVPYGTLESIRSTYKSQTMECLTDMLATWLRNGEATPEALVEALRVPGLIDIAGKVAIHYGENAWNLAL